ncbi:hypothetical protein WICPIJ_008305 [Wickerhamomyces pijperi]|uniref:F-box domain-containing protein n=1 Tax=Wickerhamomyces pijperi TaxID=599730 RepID=A0A9P8PZE7_WICPI|nr:hypothetical protein WICPIJ_008305 [Wickerhamomyces pijperi]
MEFSLFKLPTEIQSRMLHLIQSPDLRTILSIKQFHPLIADNAVFMTFTDTQAINCESYFPCDGKLFKDVNISDPESLVKVSQTLKSDKIVLLDMFFSRPDVSTLTPQTLEFITSLAKTNTVHLAYHANHEDKIVGTRINDIKSLIAIITQLTFPNNISVILDVGKYMAFEYDRLPANIYFPKVFMSDSSVDVLFLQSNQCCRLNEIEFYAETKQINVMNPTAEDVKDCDLDYDTEYLNIFSETDTVPCSLFHKRICSPTLIDLDKVIFVEDVVLENCENLSVAFEPLGTGKFGISGLETPRLNKLLLSLDSEAYEDFTLEEVYAPQLQILTLNFPDAGVTSKLPRYPNIKTESLLLGEIRWLSSCNMFITDKILTESSLLNLEVWDCRGSFSAYSEGKKPVEILQKWELPSLRYISVSGLNEFPPLKAKNLEAVNMESGGCVSLEQISQQAPGLIYVSIIAARLNVGTPEFSNIRSLDIKLSQAPENGSRFYQEFNNISFPNLKIFDFEIQASQYEEIIDFHFDAPLLEFMKLHIVVAEEHEAESSGLIHYEESNFEYQYTISLFPQLKHLLIPSVFKKLQISKCPNIETVQAYNPTYNSKFNMDTSENLRFLNLGPMTQTSWEPLVSFAIDRSRVRILGVVMDSEGPDSDEYSVDNFRAIATDENHHKHYLKLVKSREESLRIGYKHIMDEFHAKLVSEAKEKNKDMRFPCMISGV